MERIYRYVLVAAMVALISWGVWYVISHYNEQSTYEDGVLVWMELEGEMVGVEIREHTHNVAYPEVEAATETI